MGLGQGMPEFGGRGRQDRHHVVAKARGAVFLVGESLTKVARTVSCSCVTVNSPSLV